MKQGTMTQGTMKYLLIFFAGILALTIFGCDNKGPQPVPDPTADLSRGTWILNEGNFNWGNASLSFMDQEGMVYHNIFSAANIIPLGDVAQSMVRIDSSVFIVVNNSGRLFKLDMATGKMEGHLDGLTSPRFLLPISPQKAYLSDLYSGALTIVNPENCTRTGEISIGAWTEEMLLIGNEAWVTKMGSDKIVLVDINTDQVLDSITVGREPNSLVQDANGDVWVLSSGGIEEEIPELTRLNVLFRSVEATYSFPNLQNNPKQLAVSQDGQMLYFLDGDLFRMGIGDTTLPGTPFIAADNHTFYNFHLQEPFVLITDAVDFVQSGNLIQYDLSNGNVRMERKAGAIPSEILQFD